MGPVSSTSRYDALRRLACRVAGVRLVSDIHERACDLGLPLPIGRKRRARIERIAQAGLIFVHIPKVAGMSISAALYGAQTGHSSIRLLRRVADGRLAKLPSFAVLRDPAERFLSAYRYAQLGGADDEVAEPFRTLYRGFRSIDDALDHLEQAGNPYRIDHIFRPQYWYITDQTGHIAVNRLLRIEDLPRLPLLIPGFPTFPLPRLNRSPGAPATLSSRQLARLEGLYSNDFALWRKLLDPPHAEISAIHRLPLPFLVSHAI